MVDEEDVSVIDQSEIRNQMLRRRIRLDQAKQLHP